MDIKKLLRNSAGPLLAAFMTAGCATTSYPVTAQNSFADSDNDGIPDVHECDSSNPAWPAVDVRTSDRGRICMSPDHFREHHRPGNSSGFLSDSITPRIFGQARIRLPVVQCDLGSRTLNRACEDAQRHVYQERQRQKYHEARGRAPNFDH